MVTEHFAETLAPPSRKFQEANQVSMFYLREQPPRSGSTEMEKYMMDEKHIKEVIDSRADLSACDVDWISYLIFKAEKRDSIEILKQIIKASIRCGRVMTTWKEARTIFLHGKGD
jgi:hypothetical protein